MRHKFYIRRFHLGISRFIAEWRVSKIIPKKTKISSKNFFFTFILFFIKFDLSIVLKLGLGSQGGAVELRWKSEIRES